MGIAGWRTATKGKAGDRAAGGGAGHATKGGKEAEKDAEGIGVHGTRGSGGRGTKIPDKDRDSDAAANGATTARRPK